MTASMQLASALHTAPARIGTVASVAPPVPATRSVPSLEAALRDVRHSGGRITSETRTAPGIGSWAFVTDAAGVELVLWEDAPAIRS